MNWVKEMKRLLEQGWTKGCMARTASGEECDPTSPLATQFSLLGAMFVATGTSPLHPQPPEYNELLTHIPGGSMMDFNDSQETVAPIIKILESIA